ncbi:MAG: hypothetical protein ISR65_05280 [Bacteriovoracaceae bacterium]|nr:hypothetical protein [Bacteriovoracaceae bacterium]
MRSFRKCVFVLFIFITFVGGTNFAFSVPLYRRTWAKGHGKYKKSGSALSTSCKPGLTRNHERVSCHVLIDYSTEQYAMSQAKAQGTAAYQKANKEIKTERERVNLQLDNIKTIIKEGLSNIPKDLLVTEVVQLIKEQVAQELRKEFADALDK